MQHAASKRYAVFLDGPVGVGKTSYGRNLAVEFAGQFLDGDDYSRSGLPWYATSLSTSRSILNATVDALETVSVVFIAYPIRCTNWKFFVGRLRFLKIKAVLMGLNAQLTSIADGSRKRRLTQAELKRSKQMIAQGYGRRPFSDLIIQADAGDEREVTELATAALKSKIFTPT